MAQPQVARAAMEVAPARLVSLDAFRGAVIALMVLVNTAGGFSGAYGPLLHADWNGWTLADVVFPSFVWIVGLSLTLSLGNKIASGSTRSELLPQIFRRGAILFALGLFLYGFPAFDIGTWRVLGVLQRIAICYVAASLIFLYTGLRGQIVWTAGLLAAYTVLMTVAPVPGHGGGHFDVERNFAHYVDRIVLGAHNYSATKTWDPEGLVSTLPAIATALLGVLAGHLLRIRTALADRTAWFFLTGSLLLAAGLILDAAMPINKKLWTPSFTLFMAGLDCVLFASFVWLVDGQGYKRFARPFAVLGMNAIAIYMISELLEVTMHITHVRTAIYNGIFAGWLAPANASLAFALSYTALMFAVAYAMYRKRWFVRV